ncbi:hypothetical protein N8332_01340 [bacterium]|nr:hypothetical protein [bacterium]
MIAAPGNAMNVHEQNPPTDLTIFLNKAKFIETDEQFILPDPLSDPIIEQLIKRRTAETYQVKAGEYIQIIDPGGKVLKPGFLISLLVCSIVTVNFTYLFEA